MLRSPDVSCRPLVGHYLCPTLGEAVEAYLYVAWVCLSSSDHFFYKRLVLSLVYPVVFGEPMFVCGQSTTFVGSQRHTAAIVMDEVQCPSRDLLESVVLGEPSQNRHFIFGNQDYASFDIPFFRALCPFKTHKFSGSARLRFLKPLRPFPPYIMLY